jgi:hypothetical protein
MNLRIFFHHLENVLPKISPPLAGGDEGVGELTPLFFTPTLTLPRRRGRGTVWEISNILNRYLGLI